MSDSKGENKKLRQHAEEQLKAKQGSQPLTDEADPRRLLQELQVYQIELEMQNAELRQARDDNEALLDKYFDLYEFAPVGYCTLQPNSKILKLNLGVSNLLGGNRSELNDRFFADFVAPADRSPFAHFLEQVFSTTVQHSCELELLTVDSESLFVKLRANSTADADECQMVVIDVTQRKLTVDALHISEAKLSSILRSVPVGIGQVTDRTFNYVNKQFAQMLGYSIHELVGNKARIVYQSDEEFERVGHHKYLEIKKKGTGSIETVMQRKDGTLISVFMKSTPVEQNDLSHGVTFSALDITEYKQLEAERHKLLAAIQQTDETIVVTDAQAKIQYVNAAFEKITGYTTTEVIGQNPRIFQSGVHDDTFYQQMWQTLSSGESWQGRFVNKKKNGELYTEEVTISPVRDSNGTIVNYVAAKSDITERLQLEAQLRQKHKMEAVGYMAGGMAHNFNNNLSIILGNIELSKMKLPSGSEVISFLENAQIGVYRSRDLIKKISTYSRKGIQSRVTMPILTIITETTALLRSTLPTTVSLQADISAENAAVMIHADPSQIQEVLINLCNNAMQAMNERGVIKITVEIVELNKKDIPAQYEALPGSYLNVKVQDSGCGIDADILEHIFDPFFTTKEEYEGTGMGLPTVQGIVAQHDGLIKVDSVIGQGTTFNLYFPVVDTPADEVIEPDVTMPQGDEHILFVDDDPMVATLGEQMLTSKGYLVTTMTDSHEALKLFTTNPAKFDMIITDQTMPNLTGIELIEKVKVIRADMATIICTGFSRKLDEESAKELGASAFMMKPFDLPTLLQTVRRVLDDGAR